MKDEDGDRTSPLGERSLLPTGEGTSRGARRLGLLAALLLVPACFAAGVTWGGEALLGVLVGGVMALINLWLLARLVVGVTQGDQVSVGALLTRLLMKLGLLGVSLYAVLVWLQLHPIGVVMGLSVVVVATVLGQVANLLD